MNQDGQMYMDFDGDASEEDKRRLREADERERREAEARIRELEEALRRG